MMGSPKYTPIPKKYIENYDDWFNQDLIWKFGFKNAIEASEAHPVFWLYYHIGLKVRPYQLYMLDYMVHNRYLYALMARRMGKSFTFKSFGAWAIWYNKHPQGFDNTTKVVVIAHTQDGADSYIADIRKLFELGDMHMNRVTGGKITDFFSKGFPARTENARNNTEELSICKDRKKHGFSTLKSYPPTVRARGIPASVILLDEVASWYKYADENEIYYEVVRPIPSDSPDTKIFGATTPKGETGLSYQLMDIDGHKTTYELIWMPYYYRNDKDYINSILEIETEYREQGRLKQFRQEYLAELIGIDDLFFQSDEIDNVFSKVDTLTMHNRYYTGVNIAVDFGGAKNSHTVITVSALDKETNEIYRLWHKRYPVAQDSEIKEDLVNICDRYTLDKLYLDSQGGGSAFYAWARVKFSGKLVEVCFKKDKQEMYRLAKIACFQNRIFSYYDREFRTEFLSFNTSLKPEKGATDDMLDSFFMSCYDWLQLEAKGDIYGTFKALINKKYNTKNKNGNKANILIIH